MGGAVSVVTDFGFGNNRLHAFRHAISEPDPQVRDHCRENSPHTPRPTQTPYRRKKEETKISARGMLARSSPNAHAPEPPPVMLTFWTAGDLALPCSALADYLPTIRQLGPDATFAGTLRWKLNSRDWSIDLGGSRFDDIELSDLMHDVPHRLTGRASVRFERAQIDPGKAVDVSGTLTASGGFIGMSLIHSAREQLGFDAAPSDPSAALDLAYDRIGLRFDLFGPRLTLAGICHQQREFEYLQAGVVVASAGRGVVGSAGDPGGWASLVRTFWQDGRETLPASGQSAWLMSWLQSPRMVTPAPSIPPRLTGTTEYRGTSAIQAPCMLPLRYPSHVRMKQCADETACIADQESIVSC